MATIDGRILMQYLNSVAGTRGVDNAFNHFARIASATEYRAAIDTLENTIERGFWKALQKDGDAAVKEKLEKEMKRSALSRAQGGAQVMVRISQEKGEAASPMVKAFVGAAAKLTDEERSKPESFIRPWKAAIDAVTCEPTPLKPNALIPGK